MFKKKEISIILIVTFFIIFLCVLIMSTRLISKESMGLDASTHDIFTEDNNCIRIGPGWYTWSEIKNLNIIPKVKCLSFKAINIFGSYIEIINNCSNPLIFNNVTIYDNISSIEILKNNSISVLNSGAERPKFNATGSNQLHAFGKIKNKSFKISYSINKLECNKTNS
jgi:hypothetical protein